MREIYNGIKSVSASNKMLYATHYPNQNEKMTLLFTIGNIKK